MVIMIDGEYGLAHQWAQSETLDDKTHHDRHGDGGDDGRPHGQVHDMRGRCNPSSRPS